jgi:MFS family permease
MYAYIITSTLYRFLCGALLLAINWGLASHSHNNFSSLLIATTLSFAPALFIPLLAKKILQKYSGSKITAAGLVGIVSCCLFLSKFHNENIAVIVINFVIWIFFFLLESSWEMWFASIAKCYQETSKVLKYSSLSMTSNQIALMAGPIAAPFIISYIGYSLFYIIVSVLYMLLTLITLKQKDQIIANVVDTKTKINHFNVYLFISLLLIWPVLGSFNFMLPVQVTIQHGKMLDVGILDACMGVGMALIGILFSLRKKNTENSKIIFSFISILLGGVIWGTSGYVIINLGVSVTFLGIGFGGLRILLRSIMATDYTSVEIGTLVSRANACALPALACVLFISRINPTYTWIPPFMLALLISIFLLTRINLKIKEKKLNNFLGVPVKGTLHDEGSQ